jgi:hypothetical protein
MATSNSADTPSLDLKTYSLDDLRTLLNVTEDATVFQIKDAANTWIAQLKSAKKPDLAAFFLQARNALLAALLDENKDEPDPDTLEETWQPSQITPAEDDTSLFLYDDDRHFAAKEKTQAPPAASARRMAPGAATGGAATAGAGGVGGGGAAGAPANVNMTRILSVDSQFRANILPYSSSALSPSFNSRFTFNLANPVNNTVGFRLYSYQIPTTWYTFQATQGNTFFQYNGIVITVPDGNYTVAQLVTVLNQQAALNVATAGLVVSGPSPNTGRLAFTNNDPYATEVTAIFYVQQNTTNVYACGQQLAALFQTVGINNTLGWLLGFRTTPDPNTGDVVLTIPKGATVGADVPPDVYGPKYLTLGVEDYNNQRLTSGLTSITTTKTQASLSVPDYFNTIDVACKLQTGNLTKAQLFSINAVTTDNRVVTNTANTFANQLPGPNSGSTFAYIPVPNLQNLRPYPLMAFGQDCVIFERKYLKPCRLERLTASLKDDKGNLVNLNDNNWSFSLLVEQRIS